MQEADTLNCHEPNTSPFSRVTNYLHNVLQTSSTGQKLPSVRQVMQDCQVSQAVVDRALVRLQSEGLVEVRPRSGFYRMEKKQAAVKVVDLLFFQNPEELEVGNFANEFLGCWVASQRSASESFQVHRVREEPRLREVLAEIITRKPPVVITMGVDIPHLFALQELKQQGIICLNLFPNVVELIPPSLTIHEENVVRAQVEHLVSLGHRKIAFLHAAGENSYHRGINSRRDLFYKLCVEFRLDIHPDWVRYVGWKPEEIRQEVREMMTASDRPTAMIIYDYHVNPIYAELRACGLTPGKDISVVGTDDMPWTKHVDPPLTSLRVPRMRAAKMAREMMVELLAGTNIGNRFLETNLVVRESTSPVVRG